MGGRGREAALHVATRGAADAILHAMLRGRGVLTVDGAEPTPFEAGDLFLLPHGSPHVVADAAGTPGRHISALPVRCPPEGLPEVTAGAPDATGPETRIPCGTLRLDPDSRELLLPHLPTLLHACGNSRAATWLAATATMAAEQAAGDRDRAELALARTADPLLVLLLRAHVEHLQAALDNVGGRAPAGWLAAMSDPVLARPMRRLLHGDPARDWSMDELARRSGVSRTVLFERFQARLGEPPGAWLVGWRIGLARRALRRPEARVGEVGRSVGYRSEAAFTRAFTRVVSTSPSAWRRALTAA